MQARTNFNFTIYSVEKSTHNTHTHIYMVCLALYSLLSNLTLLLFLSHITLSLTYLSIYPNLVGSSRAEGAGEVAKELQLNEGLSLLGGVGGLGVGLVGLVQGGLHGGGVEVIDGEGLGDGDILVDRSINR